MTAKEKLEALRRALGHESRRGKNGELVFRCLPQCPSVKKRKSKLCVNIETDVFNCWVCGLHGRSLAQLMLPEDRAGYERDITPHVEVRSRFAGLPDEFTPLCVRAGVESTIYKDYLIKRGVPESSWSLWRIGYAAAGRYAGRVIVPSFDRNGEPNFFSARAIDDRKPPYILPDCDKDVVSNEHMVDWRSSIYLVEGVFDQIAVGPQAICLWGTSLLPNQIDTIVRRSPPHVRICLDPDAMSKSIMIAERLLSYDINCSIIRYAGKDPAAVGADVIKKATAQERIMRSRMDLIMETI